MTPQTSAERIPLPESYAFGADLTWKIRPDHVKKESSIYSDHFEEALTVTGFPFNFESKEMNKWFISRARGPQEGVSTCWVTIKSPNYPQGFLFGEEGLHQIHQLENKVLFPFNDLNQKPCFPRLSFSVPLNLENELLETKRIAHSCIRNLKYFVTLVSGTRYHETTNINRSSDLEGLKYTINFSSFYSTLRRLKISTGENQKTYLTVDASEFNEISTDKTRGKLTENIERLVRFTHAAKEGRPNEEIDAMLTMPIVPIAPKSELILSADQVRGSLPNEVRTGGTGINPKQKQQQRDVLTF